MAGPVCEVVTVAKRDLKAGERLDGVGGFCAYGLIDNAREARASGALPIGLSESCILRRDKRKDDVLSFDDVELPLGSPVNALWRQQQTRWPVLKRAAQSSPQRAFAGAAG
jgi:predicted homoserine dehydrogenase-like protein